MSIPGNPYVGPRAFRPGEKLFGRDRESDELLDLLLAERVVLLHAPSGAGKTSLLQASLIDKLYDEGLQVLPIARVKWRPPADDPTPSGANPYTYSVMLDMSRTPETSRITGVMHIPNDPAKRDPESATLEQFLTEEMGVAPDALQVLIFDQFEELLTLDPNDVAGKQAFCREIGKVLQVRSRFAIFSMREEYVGSLEPYLGHFGTRLAARYRLDFLSPEASRVSIQSPVAPARSYEPAAVDKIVDDLRRVRVQVGSESTDERLGAFVEPVHLQVVCTRIWEGLTEDQKVITLADVEKLGSVDRALRDYYANAVGRAAAEGKSLEGDIRTWIKKELIVNRLRGQALLGSERMAGVSKESLDVLENTYVIRRDERRGAIWLELAHDRLVGPVMANNNEWQTSHGDWLEMGAVRWNEHARHSSYLIKLTQLPAATSRYRALSAAQRRRVDTYLRSSAMRALTKVGIVGLIMLFAIIAGVLADSQKARNAEARKTDALERAESLLVVNERQRLALSTLVDSLRDVQEKYIYQRAWGLDSGSSAGQRRVSRYANQVLQTLVKGTRDDERARIVVRYRQKPRDKQRIESALREIGYTVELLPAVLRIDETTNSIAYGPQVPLRDLKLIALTLVRGGTGLRAICPVLDIRDRAFVAEVNYSTRASIRSPITPDQIDSLRDVRTGIHCAGA